MGSNPVASTTKKGAGFCRLSFSLLRTSTGFEGGGASGERAVCARIARKHIGWAQTGQPGGLFTGARRQRRKSRRLDQDPEMAFLPSRGLCCCEGFEPQPPKRLEMRRIILGCRFTRPPRARNARLRKHPAAVTHEGAARSRSACVREAIEPLIKTSTFRLPVEAKMIPSPRPSLLHEKTATANLCKIRCILQRFCLYLVFFRRFCDRRNFMFRRLHFAPLPSKTGFEPLT